MSSDPGLNLIYWISRGIVRLWLRIWLRFETHGGENVPATGGCLLASNHVSYLDPPVVACGIGHRVIHFLARDTLSRSLIGRWFFRSVQTIPIDRTRGDVAALKKGLNCLKRGQVLALFPEGTRSPDGELKPAKGGVGFLIAKAEVPVVPVYVEGTYKSFPKGSCIVKPGKVRVFYGPPIQPAEFAAIGDDRESYQKIGDLVMSRIAALKAEKTACEPS